MNNMEVVHLHDATSSVVIDIRGTGLPVVTHWGRTLGDVGQDALHTLADAVTGVIPNSSPDHPVAVALLPEAGAGHSGRPGLRGHRGGEHFAPALAVTSFSVEDSIFHYVAEDSAAELTVTGVVELASSGMLRLRHTVRNDGSTPYSLEALETALPAPEHATELLRHVGAGEPAWPHRGRRHDRAAGRHAGVLVPLR